MNESAQFRSKETDIENVLPAISMWPKERLRNYRYTDLDGGRTVLQVADFVELDPWPMPKPIDREGYATEENSDRYWASGLADWINVCEAMKRFLKIGNESLRLLDFGCASGRFLRHAVTQENALPEVWGCDLAPANARWIERHLPDQIHCTANTAEPDLPFENSSFDIVTAFSVFTHIDHSEIDWLKELLRIVRPGGILYLTVHNDATWSKAADRPATLKQIKNQNRFNENLKIDAEMLAGPMPQERIAFLKDNEEVYNCNVWHSDAYICREWGKHAEIIRIANNAHANFQSPVIMQVRS